MEYSMAFGTFGVFVEGDSLNKGSIYIEMIENHLVHKPTGIGFSLAPFYMDYNGNLEESHTSLLNLSIFHKSLYINEYSIVGPYIKWQWYGFERDEMSLTGGLRFSWMLDKGDYRDNVIDDYFTSLFKVVELYAGCRYYHNEWKFYSSFTMDLLSFAMLANMTSP